MLNTSAVEQALVAYAVVQLGATVREFGEGEEMIEAQAVDVDGVPLSLHAAFTNDNLKELGCWAVFHCTATPNIVGSLYDGNVTIGITAPIAREGITDATFRAHVDAIRALFPDVPSLIQRLAGATGDDVALAQAALDAANARVAALDAAMIAAANTHCTSFYVQTAGNSDLDGPRWRNAIQLKLCLLEQV